MKGIESEVVQGLLVEMERVKVSYLQFINDIILFEKRRKISNICFHYNKYLRLCPVFTLTIFKSRQARINVQDRSEGELAEQAGYEVVQRPLTYLGAPVVERNSRRKRAYFSCEDNLNLGIIG